MEYLVGLGFFLLLVAVGASAVLVHDRMISTPSNKDDEDGGTGVLIAYCFCAYVGDHIRSTADRIGSWFGMTNEERAKAIMIAYLFILALSFGIADKVIVAINKIRGRASPS